MNLSLLPLLVLATVFSAMHCQAHQLIRGGKLPVPELPSAENLVGSNWKLKQIDDIPAIQSAQQKLFFKTDNMLSGYDGCNLFSGDWGAAPNEEGQGRKSKSRPRLWIHYRSSTRRMCRLRGEAGNQRLKFMNALRQEALSFSLSADEKELTLYNKVDGGKESLVFSRIPRPKEETLVDEDEPVNEDEFNTVQLAGSFWRATDINETMVSDDADVFMFFTSETSVEGRGGCNKFFGSWETLENDSQEDNLELMSVTDLAGTYMLCDDKAMKIEDFLIRSLAKEPIFYKVEAGELTLWTVATDEDGEKTRGEEIGRFFSDRVPSWGGKSLVGMTGEEASTIIKGVNPSLMVQIIPDGWMVTADYRFDRVRIWVGDDGNVTREPQRG